MPRVKKQQKKTPVIQEERIFKSKEVKETIPNLNIEVVKGEVPVRETEVPVIRTIKEKKKRFVSEARKEQLKKARARSVEVRRQRKADAKKYNNKQPERARSVGEARVGEEYVNLDEEFLEEDTTPAPNQPYNASPLRTGVQELDYNRITDMVYNKFQSRIQEKQEQERVRQEEDNEIRQFEEGIRADERKKMAEKFRNYGGGGVMRSRRPTNATPHKSKYNLGIGGNRTGGSGGVFGNFW